MFELFICLFYYMPFVPHLFLRFYHLSLHTSFPLSLLSSVSSPPSLLLTPIPPPPPPASGTVSVDDGGGDQKRADILYLISYRIIHVFLFLCSSPSLGPYLSFCISSSLVSALSELRGIFEAGKTRHTLYDETYLCD